MFRFLALFLFSVTALTPFMVQGRPQKAKWHHLVGRYALQERWVAKKKQRPGWGEMVITRDRIIKIYRPKEGGRQRFVYSRLEPLPRQEQYRVTVLQSNDRKTAQNQESVVEMKTVGEKIHIKLQSTQTREVWKWAD